MKPGAERKDLVKNPLPEDDELALLDNVLPTEIYNLDNIIDKLRSSLLEREERRSRLIQRAIKKGIMEDAVCTIIKHEKNLARRINVEEFQRQYPDEFKLARQIIVNEREIDAKRAVNAIDDPITKVKIETAKTVLDPHMVDNICYPHEIAVTYEVMRKPKRLKDNAET